MYILLVNRHRNNIKILLTIALASQYNEVYCNIEK